MNVCVALLILGTIINVYAFPPNHDVSITVERSNEDIDGPLHWKFGIDGRVLIDMMLGINFPNYTTCGRNCFDFGSAILQVKHEEVQGFNFVWEPKSNDSPLEDCVYLDNNQWFGGPEQKRQYWPIQKLKLDNFSLVTKEDGNCAVNEPYWLSDTGAYLIFNETAPLFVDQNNRMPGWACFSAKIAGPYTARERLSFQYNLHMFDNAKLAHQHAIKTYLGKPTGVPNEKMFREPIWSTWAKYKRDVNTTVVQAFANEIIENGFTGQLEIDDDWEICYGALEFRKSKFANPKQLVSELKALGFRVTLWVHPFINTNCDPTFSFAKENGYLVKSQNGSVETQWWNSGRGEAALVDFTNPDARKWWSDRLWKLKNDTGLDSYKFDAGETSWAPQIPQLTGDLEMQPNIFTNNYVNTCAQFGDLVEVRSAYRSQNLPIFVRIVDKDTRWDFENGLPTLITTMLEMNLAGYPLVLPDMVGGNAYGDDKPTKELFIRWLQANVFMPSIQFSLVPWDFDQETVDISRKFTELHANYSEIIFKNAQRSVAEGAPLNPPVWWIDPNDQVALTIDDEFLVGEEILAAPVIKPGEVSRDVYLPKGVWRNGNTGEQHEGGAWYKNYSAPLDTLLYFVKVMS